MSGRARVFITGMGAVTPIGVGVPAYVGGLRQGAPGVRLLDFEHRLMKSTVAARCEGFNPNTILSEADCRRLPRLVPMGLAAAREAMAQAGIGGGKTAEQHSGEAANEEVRMESRAQAGDWARRVGVILGTGAGGIDFTLDQYAAFAAGGRASLWTITNATHGNLAGELSIGLGLKGPSLCISTGCASASDAVGLALEMLRSQRPGSPEVMVVVGADAHVRWETLSSMEMLRVISTRDWRGDAAGAGTASRLFDRTRDGFVLGEGAWAVVMEREGVVRRREARPLGEVCGYGVTCDAFHRVRPAPDMVESARAMELAVADAGMRGEDVEVVHYHGTGTLVNDSLETAAVKMAFGAHAWRLKGHSVKSQIGHPQGACGLAALVATLGAMTDQDGGGGAFIPPTINLRDADPECDLDYTPNAAVLTGARVALVNCLAFGAKNSALVVRGA